MILNITLIQYILLDQFSREIEVQFFASVRIFLIFVKIGMKSKRAILVFHSGSVQFFLHIMYMLFSSPGFLVNRNIHFLSD